VAEALCGHLRHAPGVKHAVVAGSVRRRRDTVGDIDLLVIADADSTVADRFVGTPGVERVLAHGPARSSVMLHEGIQVDLRVVGAESFGSAWLYLTGSKAHSTALRKRAQEVGLKLNEYGLFRGNKRIAGATEQAVYAALGLAWIAPELREDRGELQAAADERLPHLVTLDDLRGDLHAHTTESDGRDSLVSMAEAARARGMEYLAVTDHSPRVAMLHGLNAERLARQSDCIDEMNEHLNGVRLLKSVEVDILEDGSLDLPDSVLQRQDLVVAGIHEHFELPRERQTERLLRAMDHRCFTILAHPTGRLLEQRPGCDIDMERVIRHARERGCFLELNSQPLRLDIDDVACRMARDAGVLVSIGSDAHSAQQLEHLSYGLGQARRGWLEPTHVLNTRPLASLLRLIAATMNRTAPAEAALA
jgi:DNA polymerase (family 10)